MLLEPVERHVRVETRVFVVGARRGDGGLVAGQPVGKPATELARLSEMASCGPLARRDPPGRNFHSSLIPGATAVAVGASISSGHRAILLREVTADAVGEDGECARTSARLEAALCDHCARPRSPVRTPATRVPSHNTYCPAKPPRGSTPAASTARARPFTGALSDDHVAVVAQGQGVTGSCRRRPALSR